MAPFIRYTETTKGGETTTLFLNLHRVVHATYYPDQKLLRINFDPGVAAGGGAVSIRGPQAEAAAAVLEKL